jgi:outer membrane immunogenic protein
MTRIKQLLAAVGLAVLAGVPAKGADLGVNASPFAPAVSPPSWGGFFIGGFAAWASGSTAWLENEIGVGGGPPGFKDASFSESGWLGGAQIGFNVQKGSFVWGAAADGSFGTLMGASSCFPEIAGSSQSCSSKMDVLGTVVGRVGWAFGPAMIYGLAGWAWAPVNHTNLCNNCGAGGVPTVAGTTDMLINGWTAGVGGEYSFAPNWSAFVQYNYIDFGTWGATFGNGMPAILPPFTENIRQNFSMVRFGINFSFGQPNPY